jgi:hypothetical protein
VIVYDNGFAFTDAHLKGFVCGSGRSLLGLIQFNLDDIMNLIQKNHLIIIDKVIVPRLKLRLQTVCYWVLTAIGEFGLLDDPE